MASLRKLKVRFCSGSLVSPYHVLSAGTCIFEIRKENNLTIFTALIGITETRDANDSPIIEAIYHSHYDPENKIVSSNFDIGMILVSIFILMNNLCF